MYDGLCTGARTGVCTSTYGLTYGHTYTCRWYLFMPRTVFVCICVHASCGKTTVVTHGCCVSDEHRYSAFSVSSDATSSALFNATCCVVVRHLLQLVSMETCQWPNGSVFVWIVLTPICVVCTYIYILFVHTHSCACVRATVFVWDLVHITATRERCRGVSG